MVTNSFSTPPLPVKQNKYAKLEHIASFSFFSLVVAGNESARVYVRALIGKSNGIDKRCMFIGLKCIIFFGGGVLVMFFALVKIYSGQTSVESVKVTPSRRSARCCQKQKLNPIFLNGKPFLLTEGRSQSAQSCISVYFYCQKAKAHC